MHIVEDNLDIVGEGYDGRLVDYTIEDNCYVNDKFIGTTVSKKITVNILNPNNEINLENKEMKVYAGIEDELVPYGNYIISKPENEEVEEKTSFTGYDYMIKFNTPYIDTNTYPISLQNFFNNLCTQVGLEAGSLNIINGNYEIVGNPFTNNETCKTVLSAIAQLAGGFAKIGRDNKVYIINLVATEHLETIDGNTYSKFKRNDKYGKVNCLTIGLSQVNGEESSRRDEESIQANGLIEIKIEDNPFLADEADREAVIDALWEIFNGFEYTPFEITEYYGFPYLDSGDKIKVLDMEDIEYSTFIFNHKFKYNGGFSGELKTNALTKAESTYKTETVKDKFRKTDIAVDKMNGKITALASEVTDNSVKVAEVTQTVDALRSQISEVADVTISADGIGSVSLSNINESEPIRIELYPREIDIVYLYPRDNLYPSNELYPKGRTIRFASADYTVDYELPADLLYYDEENYDEFILDYEAQSCVINKRVAYNDNGTKYLLPNTQTISYAFPTIPLKAGDYTVTILEHPSAYLFVRLMVQNIYTTQFATKAEVSSEISQTAKEINLEVSKKVGDDEIISKINQSAEQVAIKADKININGTVSANGNFKIDTSGNVSIDNGTINGGYINLISTDDTKADSFMTIKNDDNPKEILEAGSRYLRITAEDGIAMIDMQTANYRDDGTISPDLIVMDSNYNSSVISGDGISTKDIWADSYNNNSREELKKNIEEYEENALQIIKDSGIYKYHYKKENDTDKKHIGFVIGEKYKTPNEAISNDGNGINTYSMCSILWKAVQELTQEIEKLKEEK